MAFDNSGTKAVAFDHPQKGVNFHLSSPQLDKPYVAEKVLILEVQICSFIRFGQKLNKLQLLKILARKLEKFARLNVYHAFLEGLTVFFSA